jgi:hypothetical protein
MTKLFTNVGNPVLIMSHPRSGTHLTIDFIRKNFKAFAGFKLPFEANHYLYLSIEAFFEKNHSKRLNDRLARKIISRPKRPLIKAHTYSFAQLKKQFPEWMEWIDTNGKTIYVYRNVLDVIRSFYYYSQSFQEGVRVPFSSFIRQSYCGRQSRIHYWNEVMLEWLTNKEALTIKFEDIIEKPSSVLFKLSTYLDEDPLHEKVSIPKKEKSLFNQRLRRLLPLAPESTAILGKNSYSSWIKSAEYSSDDLDFIYSIVHDTFMKVGYPIK